MKLSAGWINRRMDTVGLQSRVIVQSGTAVEQCRYRHWPLKMLPCADSLLWVCMIAPSRLTVAHPTSPIRHLTTHLHAKLSLCR